MRLRLLVLIFVGLGLAPGTWVRTALPSHTGPFSFTAIPVASDKWNSHGFRLKRAWSLESDHPDFGGFSALAYLGEGVFLAGSDRGYMFRFAIGGEGPHAGELSRVGPNRARNKRTVDLEALTTGPESGQIWAAFERSNTVVRYASDGTEEARVQPEAMAHWSDNSGPEAMGLLHDGRVIVIAEQRSSVADKGHEALLFPADPVEGSQPIRFSFANLDGHRPTDISIAPDGRALLVLRRFEMLGDPAWSNKLAVADPAKIQADENWPVDALVSLDLPLSADNYEGLALAPGQAGACSIWIIADNNFSALQRTLLLELEWGDCSDSADIQSPDIEKGAQVAPHAP